ncbi:pyridoxamine 5'-phosphate oxidase family protein [Sphaerisporangium perillae]|uniref:pyridoxamine 5'-phosphate oxidase family protein n=1 Tax=Sphaerisporangium perillae TaxID=2935860 RepID=UPI00200C0696|nr:pyridoxamine 5'-phosphate oxidase family protein [Sphaerisporangium perillae]
MSHGTASPGDLGRRIAYHRGRLGLSREQLADRAGMAPGYVRYLEESPASINEGMLLRLAAALETTAGELLGGATDRPPGQSRPSVRPVLHALEREECLRLISPGGVGRVAFNDPSSGPVVVPVNYVFHEGAVVFRTQAGGLIDQDLRSGVAGVEIKIGFEVDHIDEAMRGGWSVLVQGPGHHVSAEELPEAARSGVEPWAGGERDLYIRIVPHEVTGRRIEVL